MTSSISKVYSDVLRDVMVNGRASPALVNATHFAHQLEDVMCDLVIMSKHPAYAEFLNLGSKERAAVRKLFAEADHCYMTITGTRERVSLMTTWKCRQALENQDVKTLGSLEMIFTNDYKVSSVFRYEQEPEPA